MVIKNFIAFSAGKIKPTAKALSLIKGFEITEDGEIELISHFITRLLDVIKRIC